MANSMKKPVTLQSLQEYVASQKSNKRKHKRKYFLKLIEEVGELATALTGARTSGVLAQPASRVAARARPKAGRMRVPVQVGAARGRGGWRPA